MEIKRKEGFWFHLAVIINIINSLISILSITTIIQILFNGIFTHNFNDFNTIMGRFALYSIPLIFATVAHHIKQYFDTKYKIQIEDNYYYLVNSIYFDLRGGHYDNAEETIEKERNSYTFNRIKEYH